MFIENAAEFKSAESRRHEDVTFASLGESQGRCIDNGRINVISMAFEEIDTCLKNAALIMDNCWDVLNQRETRAQYMDGPNGQHVKLVSGVRPARAVIQVGVSLARRSCKEHIKPIVLPPQTAFGSSHPFVGRGLEDIGQILAQTCATQGAEIVLVDA